MPQTFTFTEAVKGQEWLRMALDGPTGGGKTWTALEVGTRIAELMGRPGEVALIDSERSSSLKYAPYFSFRQLTLPNFDPNTYIAALEAAIDQGFPVIIIDSLTHAWEGTLDLKDKVTRRSASHNGFDAWREVTPIHNRLVDTMLRAPAHVIVTMRTKMEYIVESDERGKVTGVNKVGTRPQQREGVEYEFDIVADMDTENNFTVTKTRCHDLTGVVVNKPSKRLADTIYAWLTEGAALIGPAEADGLVQLMNAVGDEGERRALKFDFVARFGRPEQLIAERLDEAVTWLESRTEMNPANSQPERQVESSGSMTSDEGAKPEPKQREAIDPKATPMTTETSPTGSAVPTPVTGITTEVDEDGFKRALSIGQLEALGAKMPDFETVSAQTERLRPGVVHAMLLERGYSGTGKPTELSKRLNSALVEEAVRARQEPQSLKGPEGLFSASADEIEQELDELAENLDDVLAGADAEERF